MSAELNVSRAARGASFATGGCGIVTGAAADGFGLGLALFVPAACCLYIASYGWFARQEVRP